MKDDPRKRPLWSPDKDGRFHLGDLMFNIEECKRLDREDKEKKKQ